METLDVALARKTLEQENAALRLLLQQLQDAQAFQRERLLVDSVKKQITAWARAAGAVLVATVALLGYSSYQAARDAVIKSFSDVSEPKLQQHFKDVILPDLKKKMQDDAAKKLDEYTSASEVEFRDNMNALLEENRKFALENKLPPPKAPSYVEKDGRPTAGYVLTSFLTKSTKDIYVINTYRLNVRDVPNGKIEGRQVKDARVRVTETNGEWSRIEVIGPPKPQ